MSSSNLPQIDVNELTNSQMGLRSSSSSSMGSSSSSAAPSIGSRSMSASSSASTYARPSAALPASAALPQPDGETAISLSTIKSIPMLTGRGQGTGLNFSVFFEQLRIFLSVNDLNATCEDVLTPILPQLPNDQVYAQGHLDTLHPQLSAVQKKQLQAFGIVKSLLGPDVMPLVDTIHRGDLRGLIYRLRFIFEGKLLTRVVSLLNDTLEMRQDAKESTTFYLARASRIHANLIEAVRRNPLDALETLTAVVMLKGLTDSSLNGTRDLLLNKIHFHGEQLTLPQAVSQLENAMTINPGRGLASHNQTKQMVVNASAAFTQPKHRQNRFTCFHCGRPGHYAKDCRGKKKNGNSNQSNHMSQVTGDRNQSQQWNNDANKKKGVSSSSPTLQVQRANCVRIVSAMSSQVTHVKLTAGCSYYDQASAYLRQRIASPPKDVYELPLTWAAGKHSPSKESIVKVNDNQGVKVSPEPLLTHTSEEEEEIKSPTFHPDNEEVGDIEVKQISIKPTVVVKPKNKFMTGKQRAPKRSVSSESHTSPTTPAYVPPFKRQTIERCVCCDCPTHARVAGGARQPAVRRPGPPTVSENDRNKPTEPTVVGANMIKVHSLRSVKLNKRDVSTSVTDVPASSKPIGVKVESEIKQEMKPSVRKVELPLYLANAPVRRELILDSGAAQSMVSSKHFPELQNVGYPCENTVIEVANGERLESPRMVSLQLKQGDNTLLIKDVLIHDKLVTNLISVSHLLSQPGVGRMITDQQGAIITNEDQLPWMSARLERGLYVFDEATLNEVKLIGSNTVQIQTSDDRLRFIHARLGHKGQAGINQLIRNNVISGIGINTTPFCRECDACRRAKQTRTSFNHQERSQFYTNPSQPNSMVVTDTAHVGVRSIGGNRYAGFLTDVFSNYVIQFPFRKKSDVPDLMRSALRRMHNMQRHAVKILHTDNGTEIVNQKLKDYCTALGIIIHTSSPYTPQHNSVAERINRTIFEGVRALINHCGTGRTMWAEALKTVVLLHNHFTIAPRGNDTPHNIYLPEQKSRPGGVHKLKVWGCDGAVQIAERDRENKLSDRSKLMMFVGYDDMSFSVYRMLDIDTDKIITTRDVIFMEDKFTQSLRAKEKYKEERDDEEDDIWGRIAFDNETRLSQIISAESEVEGNVIPNHQTDGGDQEEDVKNDIQHVEPLGQDGSRMEPDCDSAGSSDDSDASTDILATPPDSPKQRRLPINSPNQRRSERKSIGRPPNRLCMVDERDLGIRLDSDYSDCDLHSDENSSDESAGTAEIGQLAPASARIGELNPHAAVVAPSRVIEKPAGRLTRSKWRELKIADGNVSGRTRSSSQVVKSNAAKTGRGGRRRMSVSKREEYDKRNLDDYERVKPPAADLPSVKNGRIDMGSQLCAAKNKEGKPCNALTRHGAYCWQHLQRLQGLRIKSATVKQHGQGLFAARDYRPGETVSAYTGDDIDMAQVDDYDPRCKSVYQLGTSKHRVIDAARTNSAPGRIVNDARGTGRPYNCTWVYNRRTRVARIVTTRHVKCGDEFYVSYGSGYWKRFGNMNASHGGDGRVRPADKRMKIDQTGRKSVGTNAVSVTTRSVDSELYLPTTYNKAMQCAHRNRWIAAQEAELASLAKHQVWSVVPRPPYGKKLVTSKWVYTIKMKSDGTVDRYKARLVARGFTQVHGIDYDETYAPVVAIKTLRILLAIVAAEDMELKQMDVETAFLYGELKEEVYMAPPPGVNVGPGQVLKLNKSLYGLKQAPREWNRVLSKELIKLGYNSDEYADSCLFVRLSKNKRKIIIAVFVDDLLWACNKIDTPELLEDQRKLMTRFKIKDLGDAKLVLGMEIERDRSINKLILTHRSYINGLLEDYGYSECRSFPTPESLTTPGKTQPAFATVYNSAGGNENATHSRIDINTYSSAVGSLSYLAQTTRPDIAHAVNRLTRHLVTPTRESVLMCIRVYRYLSGTVDLGLCYYPTVARFVRVVGYSDADWAGDPSDAKSTSGMCIIISNAAVAWWSKKQPVTAQSSSEAEYVSASECGRELVWVHRMVDKIMTHPLTQPIPLLVDNQTAVKMTNDESESQRRKHINVRYHWLREQVKNSTLRVDWVRGDEQLADVFTKPLGPQRFTPLVQLVMGQTQH